MSLINTYLQDIRAQFPTNVDRDEWRFTRYGMLTTAKEMTDGPMTILTDDIKQKALQSEGRVLQVPVMTDGLVTVNNVRSCTIGTLENTSELLTITWFTMSADLSMIKEQYKKNEIAYLQDLQRKLLKIDHSFAKVVEDAIYTKLDAEKSIVYNSPLVGALAKYPLVGDTMQVAAVDQEYFFNDLEAIMEGDDFYSMPFKVLGNTTLKPYVKHWGHQGQQNDENLLYQFDGYDFRFSNHLVNAGGVNATGFCMSDGTIGILSRIAADSVSGNRATDGTEWGTLFLDNLGYEVGYQYKSSCADSSGIAGLEHLKASLIEQWQLSVDIALVTPYNSDSATNPGVIKKFEFLP